MSSKITRLRGMYDVTPDQVWVWQKLEHIVTSVLNQYGYQEIRFPILEKTALFHSAIGEVTDVVEKEMFTFETRKGESISMRPEGTASTVRAVLQNGLIFNDPQKLWYNCPMFRYEKPQKGRNRQFSQVGVEVFGFDGPDVDAELLLMTKKMWDRLGIKNVRLEINTLGTAECRAAYRDVLIAYFEKHADILDADAKKRLHTNPLRILDSKNPALRALIADAPMIKDYLSDASQQHFQQLCEILDDCGLVYEINPKLVRGLDYYTHNVFEWITDDLGAQGTICAGGRYDRLVEMQGGKPTAATGFAMGVDRLVELILDHDLWQNEPQTQVFLIRDKQVPDAKVIAMSEQIRNELPELKMTVNMGQASFKSQFKKADKSGAQFAIIIGEEEMNQGVFSLKALHDRDFGQKQFTFAELVEFLHQL
ncbi:histidine--tRNA ligase [Marinicella sp. S1101]|uniref:histidine--tRNA ligase n=1 Tax=Marinicella marina TaxID=2996016 RepID=UPI0022610044|nr:histidine--tRNA ligase [Marinicella marina]MCX7553780.1 histidine--tRNA ligase [Marinicella marina]MDJ1140855.1 histidine--tRNA ligase [Marinicella marina]